MSTRFESSEARKLDSMNELASIYWAALRRDFMVSYEKCFALLEPGTEFLDNWHLHAIADALHGVEAGETTRLIINVRPGPVNRR